MERKINIISKIVNSMEKVFPEIEPSGEQYFCSIFKNETFNFQLCYKYDEADTLKCAKIVVKGDLSDFVSLYNIEYVPVTNLPINKSDDYYLKKEVGLYPDVLTPLGKLGVVLPHNQWRSVWVKIKGNENIPVGKHVIEFELNDEIGNVLNVLKFEVEILDIKLDETNLKLTNWIHYDCISDKYNVELFTDDFYKIFDVYLKSYVDLGFNMLYTPLFTPPLDTKIGGERKTAQLIKVELKNNKYFFDFYELEKFIKFALDRNIKYIEFSHLFTQWGGKYCPKIIVEENGKEKTMFGWNKESDSLDYINFLTQFLTELNLFIKRIKIQDICYFHITDEPSKDQLPYYKKCSNIVRKYIDNIKIMDAMGDCSFYEQHLVDIPIVELSSFDKFKDVKVDELYIYNCCYPVWQYYSNRHIMMPSQRTRILGFQMYDINCQGYLHWGYNFYNSQFSLYEINPYYDTCSGESFPGGDGFIVYPSKEYVVLNSIRAENVRDCFNDYRVLLTLERLVGREKVCDFLHSKGILGLTRYPKNSTEHIRIRQELNNIIKTQIDKSYK